MIAAGALFQYLNETQKTALSHMATIHPYTADKFMLIDSSSRRNLELVETLRENRNEVLFSGYWIRQRQQWVHVHFEVMWNSPDRCRRDQSQTGSSRRTDSEADAS